MSERVPISLDLKEPDATDTSSPLARVISGHLSSRGRDRGATGDAIPLSNLWDASFFGLDRATRFREASPEVQKRILAGCARQLLNEAYFIEKSGTAYCAKMILLADSTEVRQAYALIAADEATHLQWIRPFVAEEDRSKPAGALLDFLAGLILQCDRNTLAYLVQIILEGWGLHHYRDLAGGCRDPALASVFSAIHKDEALHHHTGEIVFDPAQVVTRGQKSLIRDSLRAYTEMVRVGPQGVVSELDQQLGGIGRQGIAQTFAELETETTSRAKLVRLRDLMQGPGREGYLAELEEAGAFTPYDPDTCAALVPG